MSRRVAYLVLLSACAPASDRAPGIWLPHVASGDDFDRGGPVTTIAPHPPETWYLDADGARATLVLRDDTSDGWTGYLADDTGRAVPADAIERGDGELSFRHELAGGAWEWVEGTVVAGVFAGRRTTTPGSVSSSPTDPLAWTGHITGWQAEAMDVALVPRVWELALDDGRRARVHIDRSDTGGALVGSFKVYGSAQRGALDESWQYDLDSVTWDGQSLAFTLPGMTFTGAVAGRAIAGRFTDATLGSTGAFTGARAEVLSYGLASRSPAARARWQSVTRERLRHLMMGDDPPPLSTVVTEIAVTDPIASTAFAPGRDDNPAAWPQAYTLHELAFAYTIASPLAAGAPLARAAHGFLAVPTTPPPPGGYPAVVAFNGHDGSARKTFDPGDGLYWYADAWARRGFVVISLDVGHRPLEDRDGLYSNYLEGDAPADGNGPHPAVHVNGLDSDWEEDGERAWDGERAIDYLRSLPSVNGARIVATGLSMGGEVASWLAAMDPRVALTVAAGYSSDMGVMEHHGNHLCFEWTHGDLREYLDVADLHALVAPRSLIVETGAMDGVFSSLSPPFASDKQVMRRSRVAYADAPARVTHYLHYDFHRYHFGDVNPSSATPRSVTAPSLIAPLAVDAWQWQTDPATAPLSTSLFDLVSGFLL